MSKSMTVGEYMGYMSPGDIGIEIECETNSDKRFPAVGGWTKEADGSLRGNCVEYVSDVLSYKDVGSSLHKLKLNLEKTGITLNNSIRTGVHIHLDFIDMNKQQIINFICLYAFFERPLLRFCGINREYNHFCLPLLDCECVLDYINKFKNKRGCVVTVFQTNNLRYCALNLKSLSKHGTIEFRAMETRPNLSGIEDMINILQIIKEKSLQFNNTEDLLEIFSMEGAKSFSRKILGLKNNLKLKPKEEELIEGMRMAQNICYGV